MKRLITVIPAAIIMLMALGTGAHATGAYVTAYEAEVDYTELMIDAAVTGDYEKGYAAELARNEKIDGLGLTYQKYSFSDLMLLSKIIYAEAGSEWLSDEWKMCVGEVVMNRVASPEFPNSIEAVLTQPGQYYGSGSTYFNRIIPSARCTQAAVRLLSGERLMDSTVVFQANFRQGSGTCLSFYDNYLGWTYFCYSNRPDLYA